MTTVDKPIKPHDFRRGDVVERVTLQTLEGLFQTFTRSLTQKFTGLLHHPCIFEITRLDQMSWGDITPEIANGMYFFTFSMHPLPGRGIIALPAEEVLVLVDLRLSGSGDGEFSDRMPSEIDQSFLATLMDDFLGEFGGAIAKFQQTMPNLEAQEGNLLFINASGAADMFMVIRLGFSLAERAPQAGLICLPFDMVQQIIGALHAKGLIAKDRETSAHLAAARKKLMEVPLEVVLQFPSFMTTPEELTSVQVGDTLSLGHLKGRPLEVRAEGLLVALAEVCSSGVHKAFEVHEEIYR